MLHNLKFCRFLARKFDLAGDGEVGFAHADMILEHVKDYRKGQLLSYQEYGTLGKTLVLSIKFPA